jgi:hypothetical protein
MPDSFDSILRRVLERDAANAPKPDEDPELWMLRTFTNREMHALLAEFDKPEWRGKHMIVEAYRRSQEMAAAPPSRPGGQIDVVG